MSSLRDIRSRINSVKSTKQITAAMKMVSAAKLKKAQDSISRRQKYVETIEGIIEDLSRHKIDVDENNLGENREVKNVLILLIASNKGLCGAFNNNVGKRAVNLAKTKYPFLDENNIKFFCFGKKAIEFISKTKYEVFECNNVILDNIDYKNISNLAEQLMSLFKSQKFDKIEVVYNKLTGAALSKIQEETFLPYSIKYDPIDFPAEYIFEPELEYIRSQIVPDYLKSLLFSIFLENLASEHAARMTAMHQATDNAGELLKELTLQYNKARQAEITKEILEITSGADALKGK